jgi:glycosyltransferase involved in cell wall biosynthesis
LAETPHFLSIVIPVLNEEAAIGDTVRRCLEARSHIIRTTTVEQVEIIVVSDGSTDRSEVIAKSFDDVQVIVFEKNRGYGAAIKCGWEYAKGDLLAFLDGDGTPSSPGCSVRSAGSPSRIRPVGCASCGGIACLASIRCPTACILHRP